MNIYEIGAMEERARGAVWRALKSGKLVRPATCSRCNIDPGVNSVGYSLIQAHHLTYDDPLNVIWLCHRCHTDEHMAVRRWESGETPISGPAQVAIEMMLKGGVDPANDG